MNYEWRCLACGCFHSTGVMCRDLGKWQQRAIPSKPSRPLTEEDVRRIVREEIERALTQKGSQP